MPTPSWMRVIMKSVVSTGIVITMRIGILPAIERSRGKKERNVYFKSIRIQTK